MSITEITSPINGAIYERFGYQVARARAATQALSGTYVFAGPRYSGKAEAADWLAAALLCVDTEGANPCYNCANCHQAASGNHPDLLYLEKLEDKRNISIEQVREFISRLTRGAFIGRQQVAIIRGAEFLNDEGANSLLKTLEEPTRGTVIILLTEEPDRLLATIMSRSQQFFFRPASKQAIATQLEKTTGLKPREAAAMAKLSLGRWRLAK